MTTTLKQIILSRRSVRKFQKRKFPENILPEILDSGRWAPSGLNNQPWRFLTITKKEQLCGLAQFTESRMILEQAAAAIVVCLDKHRSYHREKDLMALGACIQNMLLQAQALKLGTCWLGEIWNRKGPASQFLELPDDCELTAVIALGYPKGKTPKSPRRPLRKILLPVKISE